MKLYLAVAVLMLALVAQTEAQEPLTVKERFLEFGTQVSDATRDLASQTQDAFEQMHNSEFAVSTRNWFSKEFERLKKKLGQLSDLPQ